MWRGVLGHGRVQYFGFMAEGMALGIGAGPKLKSRSSSFHFIFLFGEHEEGVLLDSCKCPFPGFSVEVRSSMFIFITGNPRLFDVTDRIRSLGLRI